ncbi:hypothetical protein LINPERHAP2_LOCUS28795, partial [Linum perenne]
TNSRRRFVAVSSHQQPPTIVVSVCSLIWFSSIRSSSTRRKSKYGPPVKSEIWRWCILMKMKIMVPWLFAEFSVPQCEKREK